MYNMKGKILKKKVHTYTAIFEADENDGGYTVTVPSLPGCISEGETFEDAMENIQEAANLYLEVANRTNKELLPEEHGVIVAPLRVRI